MLHVVFCFAFDHMYSDTAAHSTISDLRRKELCGLEEINPQNIMFECISEAIYLAIQLLVHK